MVLMMHSGFIPVNFATGIKHGYVTAPAELEIIYESHKSELQSFNLSMPIPTNIFCVAWPGLLGTKSSGSVFNESMV
jgi:hypothetical protein